MRFYFTTRIFHSRRKPPFQSHLLKPPDVICSFSAFAAETQSHPFYRTALLHIFQECSKKKALEPGRQTHARMIVSGFEPSVFADNCLIQVYMKCSRLECAAKVFDIMPERDLVSWNTIISGYSVNGKMGFAQSFFDLMPERNVISWTSLISGYLQNGNCSKSIEVFVMMGRDAVAYNETTLSVVLKAISSLEEKVLGVQVHGLVMKLGFECDVVTGTAMLDMYARCKMLDESLRIFDAMPLKTSVSWSAIIAGSVQNGELEVGLMLFKEMKKVGVGITKHVYASVFKSCAGLTDSSLGSQMHGQALKSDVGADTIVGTAILDMYAKCDDLLTARKVFDSLPNHNLRSFNALIVGYGRDDRRLEGIQLFVTLLNSDLGYDEISLSAVFSACAVSKGLLLGIQIHVLAIKTPFHDDISVANAILNMYGKCGALPEACRIFDEMEKSVVSCCEPRKQESFLMSQKPSNRNLVTWNTMVSAYAQHGNGNEALQMFGKMLLEKVMPDHVTFVAILRACARSGLLDEALHYFNIMQNDYGLEPQLEHYTSIIDALGRSSRIIDAKKLIEDMPFKANDVIWTSLLSNCRTHGNVKVGEIAASSLLQLDPQDSSAHVLLLNIYADAGMWDEASKIRRMMRRSGLKKEPGCSWIEVSSL